MSDLQPWHIRPGSLLWDPIRKEVVEVDSVHASGRVIVHITEDENDGLLLQHLEGIPLTREVLKASGFSGDYGNYRYRSLRFVHDDFFHLVDERFRPIGKPFLYVHELQNIVDDLEEGILRIKV